MSTEIMLDRIVTQTYTNLLQKKCRELNVGFFLHRGNISYDLENEMYLFDGFTDEELQILKRVTDSLQSKQAA